MIIYLIGMPGSGKSTLGKIISHENDLLFIDLDDYIVQKENKTIPDIFMEFKEEYFRNIETKLLEEVSINFDKDIIISTGGGIIKREENIKIMKENGIIIYLSCSINNLKTRVEKNIEKRPLLKEKTIEELFEERKNIYESVANYIINRDNSLEINAKEIKEIYEKEKKSINN